MTSPGVITTTNVSTIQAPGAGERILFLVGKSPIATAGVGVPVLVTSVTQAQASFGTDTSNGNILPRMIEQAFAQSSIGESANRVLVASVGTNTPEGTSSTITTAIEKGATSFDLASGTGFATDDVVAIDTGVSQEIVEILTVSTDTITLKNAVSIAHESGVTFTKLTVPADTAYETALNNSLSDEYGQIEAVVTDSTSTTVNGYLLTHVNDSSSSYELERYGVIAGPQSGATTADFTALASASDSDRIIVVGGSLKDNIGNTVHPGVTATAFAQHITSERQYSKPLRTVALSGFTGVHKTWSKPELNTLYQAGVCPLKYDYERGVVVIFEDVTTGFGDTGKLGYIPQRRVADFVEKNLKSVVAPAYGRENNSPETRTGLKKYILQILNGYAQLGHIPTGLQEYKGTVIDTTPGVSVAPDALEPTKVNVQVSYFVYYEARTIDIQIALHN